MASSHNTSHSESARLEQIITEFYTKSLHIILESRSPYVSSRNFSGEQVLSSPSSSSSSSSSVKPRDKWFNLALRESLDALENFDLWRQSNHEPMVVDVILVQRPLHLRSNFSSKEPYFSDQEDYGCDGKTEKIIERWILHYESRTTRDTSTGSRRSSNSLHSLYKKSILLLRSLYVTVRLLPAYKIFRDLNSSSQICSFSLVHKVSSLVEPFTHKEEAEMQHFGFTPVDTSCGRLILSVLYRSSVSGLSSEPSSTPMSPQLISNYVGSPLADRLKRFPSLPVALGSRPQSWSYDNHKTLSSTVTFSPLKSQASVFNTPSYYPPPMSLPSHQPGIYMTTQNTNFTPSLLPPPICTPAMHPSKGLLRSGSAPVRIPESKKNFPIPFEGLISGNGGSTQIRCAVDKNAKDEAGTKSLEQLSLPRSTIRSLHDDFDDIEFPCPFDVDDDDGTALQSRREGFDKKKVAYTEDHGVMRKSQDAAVGSLVQMLQKAPPLRQDLSTSINISETQTDNTEEAIKQHIIDHDSASSTSAIYSRLVASKTTADALQELKGYREMKNSLVSRSQIWANSAFSSSQSSS